MKSKSERAEELYREAAGLREEVSILQETVDVMHREVIAHDKEECDEQFGEHMNDLWPMRIRRSIPETPANQIGIHFSPGQAVGSQPYPSPVIHAPPPSASAFQSPLHPSPLHPSILFPDNVVGINILNNAVNSPIVIPDYEHQPGYVSPDSGDDSDGNSSAAGDFPNLAPFRAGLDDDEEWLPADGENAD
ncbi:MAG: hypothetical protein JKY09_08135 [Crocinitomicaceae bacterium]|nr:hypothetical protein [Crocinitomicaceae bacterium]